MEAAATKFEHRKVIGSAGERRQRSSAWLHRAITAAGIASACLTTDLAAQNQGTTGHYPQTTADTLVRPQEASDSAPRVSSVPTALPLLDAAVERDEYLLGAGDALDLSIVGDVNRQHRLRVTPEGILLVPSAGVVRVEGLNLNQAQAQVRRLLYRYFDRIEVFLNLAEVRQFKVFIAGDVSNPGVRAAFATTRVSEVLEALDSDTVHRRTVLVVRMESGDTLVVDLARFGLAGDLSANPFLKEGDVVIVPPEDETVSALGRVAFPGRYAYRRGETLAEILWIANGGQGLPADAGDTVRVSRAIDDVNREVFRFHKTEAIGPEGRNFILQPFDAVFVPKISEYRQENVVTVVGHARYPGSYPVVPEQTTVMELLEMAGGLTEVASMSGATLRRVPSAASEKWLLQLQNTPPELLNSQERRVLQEWSRGDRRRVVIDFPALLEEGANTYNQVLQPGDTLMIPRRTGDVTLVGAVMRPGVLQYVPMQNTAYYVEQAKGFVRTADRSDVIVVKARTGARVDDEDIEEIEPGDLIIVPHRQDRDWLEILQQASAVVTTATGLVLTFLAIF